MSTLCQNDHGVCSASLETARGRFLTNYDLTSGAFWVRLSGRAFARSWGRDVMLYTGGVSFFALLAVFPAIAILIGLLKAVMTIGQVSEQAAALADLLPYAARTIFESEISRLAETSARTVSAQSAFALIVGAYAAHRGFKALLAGLNLIHDETQPHGFVKFNMLALFVALFAFALFTVVSGAVVASRVVAHTSAAAGAAGGLFGWDDLWPSLGLLLGLSCLYRYAMSHQQRVAWFPAIAGGLVATILSMVSSWLCAIYVSQIAPLGATYGSVAALVVLLIWLSWNVNAVFYGGAFATEIEIAQKAHERQQQLLLEGPKEDAEAEAEPAPVVSLLVARRLRRGS